MSHLMILIELEENCTKLELIEKKLKELESNPEIIALNRAFRGKEKKLAILKDSIEKNSLEISRLSEKLDSSISRIKALDKMLYEGSIKDIKQLEHMEKEKNGQTDAKQRLETEAIEYMEHVDILDSQIRFEEKDLLELKNLLKDKKKVARSQAAVLEEEIRELKRVISKLELQIDPELLLKYYSIRSKRGSGLGIIKNEICLGCHMRVATTMIDKIKTGKQVCYCENCGRIHILFPEQS